MPRTSAAAAIAGALVTLAQAGPAMSAATVPAPVPAIAAKAITLAPHITELIFAAGAGDKIVATVTSSDYPAAARKIPKIGTGIHISVEKIIALKPDVIIAWMPSGAAQTLSPSAAALHIPIVYSRPEKLDDIPHEMLRYGLLFGTQAVAEPSALALQERLKALRKRYAQRSTVTVFIEVGAAPLYTIGRDPLLGDALKICGGANIYAQALLAAPQVSVESVLVAQPDIVITSIEDTAALEQRRRLWAELRLDAALEHHIYAINPDELFRPGPRLVDATEKLCQYLDSARKSQGRPGIATTPNASVVSIEAPAGMQENTKARVPLH